MGARERESVSVREREREWHVGVVWSILRVVPEE